MSAKPKPGDWVKRAACKGQKAAVFFPSSMERRMVITALRLCSRCPVKAECLDYAQTSPLELDGVWGGKTPDERKELRRRKGAA